MSTLISPPVLVGREEELAKLKLHFEMAMEGKGSTLFITGEAGIGKTRLVSELIKEVESKDVRIIRGWCHAESLEPLFPFRTALRDAGLFHMISGDPPPFVISAYLIDRSGLLAAKAEREELGLDAYVFAGMLKVVGDFVHDSLAMMGKEGGGGLSALEYERYKILIQSKDEVSLAIVMEGRESEFLIDDMRRVLAEIAPKIKGWSGAAEDASEIAPRVEWFITSEKYDGTFLVEDPKLKQENLFDNMLLGIQRASMERPLVLFLDDLHWADPTSLTFLHYLARNTRKHRVLILGTYRPEDIVQSWDGRTHQLETTMQNMSREDLLQKLELKRLEKAGTESLITNALGASHFEEAFFEKIYGETEGNPFFVLEVVKLVVEEGTLVQDDEGAWKLIADLEKLDIPSRVHDVVKRRLDRLMKEQREILECAAVIGEVFTTDILEKTTEIRKITLLKSLSEIENTHKLIHSMQKKYRFDHAKIREVLYNGIIDELRQEYHRIIAETIAELHKEDLVDVLSELAHHYYEAGDERAGEFLVRSGYKAKERFANQEAVRLYRTALETVTVDEERVKILESLGDVHTLAGEYDKAIERFEKAGELTEHGETKAMMLRKVGDVHEKKGEYDKSLEVLAKAKELVDEKTAEYSRILFGEGYPYWRKGDYDRAMSLFQEAVKTFEEFGGEQKDIGNALRAIGNIHLSKGEYEPALQYYKKSLTVMENVGDKVGTAAALNNIGNVHYFKGELDRALEFHQRSLEMFEKIGDKRGIALALTNIGIVHLNNGELDRALEFHRRSLEMFEKIGDQQGIGASLINIGLVHRNKGELDRALEFHRRSLDIRENIGNKGGIALSLNNIGLVHHERGELGRALEFYERSLETCLEIGDKWLSIHNYCDSAETNLELGKVPKALENAEKAAAIAIEIGAKAEEGISRRVIGMVYREMGNLDKAKDELEKGIAICEDINNIGERPRALYEYALLVRAMGMEAKAKENMERALSLFGKMGKRLWAEKTRRALERFCSEAGLDKNNRKEVKT